MKEHVLVQLPPKRRQIIRVVLKKSDMISAKAAVKVGKGVTKDVSSEHLDEPNGNLMFFVICICECNSYVTGSCVFLHLLCFCINYCASMQGVTSVLKGSVVLE